MKMNKFYRKYILGSPGKDDAKLHEVFQALAKLTESDVARLRAEAERNGAIWPPWFGPEGKPKK